MLQCCGSDEDELTVLEFFAVGKTARALLCHAVKGGGRCQKRTYLQFSRFQWSRFLWLRFFIGYFTLPKIKFELSITYFITFVKTSIIQQLFLVRHEKLLISIHPAIKNGKVNDPSVLKITVLRYPYSGR